MRSQAFVGALLLAAACLGACQNDQKTTMTWQNPVYSDLQFKKVMVIAITNENDRRTIEETAANGLTNRHVNATPSVNLFSSLDQIDGTALTNFARSDRIDAIVTIIPFEVDETVSKTDWAVAADQDLREVVVAETTTTETVGDFGIEITIWNTKDWRAVWVGRSDVFVESETQTEEIADYVVDSVQQHGAL